MNGAAGERRVNRPEDDVKLYISVAKLPEMILADTAPPVPPPQHKSHANRLHVQPERYRAGLAALISCRGTQEYDQLARTFAEERLPNFPLDVPSQDARTGAAFTIPVRGMNYVIQEALLPRPNTLDSMTPWFYAYPFQSLTRTMQVAFPRAAANWSIAPLPVPDVDRSIWQTYVWRKSPPPSDLETYYRAPQNPIPECSLIICVQPSWVLSEADIDSFKNVGSFPKYDEDGNNRPYKSAYRIWGKLWDLCVRVKCRFWVLTTYQRWIFGTFSKSFKAGHIFTIKSFDSHYPTVLQTLVFHTAKSMGLANNVYIPEYLDSTDDDGPPDDLPYLPDYPDMNFANSDSEWDGMDDEPGVSAGVSDYLDSRVSAHGSAANIELPVVRVFRTNANRRPPRAPPRRRRSTPSPPVAGPSRLGPTLLRARRDSGSGSSRSRSTASPRPAGSDNGVAQMADDDAPTEPVREYWGISRATEQITDSVLEWTDNIEEDEELVDGLAGVEILGILQVELDERLNPRAISRALGIEPIYHAALQTVDEAGGPSLSVPQPPEVTVHRRGQRHTGGYMNVIAELGPIREVEETEAAEEQARRDNANEALWRQYETVGFPVPEGDNIDVHDALALDRVHPSASRA